MASPAVSKVIGGVASTFILLYFCAAWYVCCYEIGYGIIWEIQGRRRYAAGYIISSTLIISAILRAFLYLYFLPFDHCSPPKEPPSLLDNGLGPFACASEQRPGRLAPEEQPLFDRCTKGTCAGCWKPGRTRHCSVCGKCRTGFDHHCPWFGNCLTLPHMKAFLFLTTLATIGIPIIAYPPSVLIYNDLRKVLVWSYVDKYMQEAWWTRWYSWIPGPVGRWAIGITWSYWTYSEEMRIGMRAPSGFHLFLLTVGVGITFVALGLTIGTILRLSKGELTVDQARRKAYNKLKAVHEKAGKTPDVKLVSQIEAMAPDVKLFIPDLGGRFEGPSQGRSSGGTVVQVPVTWRGGDVHSESLLRAVWNGPLFPDYAHCQRWDEDRFKDVTRLQGYL